MTHVAAVYEAAVTQIVRIAALSVYIHIVSLCIITTMAFR